MTFYAVLHMMARELTIVVEMGSSDFELMCDIMAYMSRYPDFAHHPKEDLMLAHLIDLDDSAQPLADLLNKEHLALAEKGNALLAIL